MLTRRNLLKLLGLTPVALQAYHPSEFPKESAETFVEKGAVNRLEMSTLHVTNRDVECYVDR